MIKHEFINEIRQTDAKVLTNISDCFPYGSDNSRLHETPSAVVLVTKHEQVEAVIKGCIKHNIALTARGRGTATTGAAVPKRNGMVISFERMNQIGHFDAGSRTLRVEPGVLNQQVQDYCKPYGFFWAPDPGSANFCTVGGNIACNAAGPHALKYGSTRENVLGLKAVCGDGKTIITGVQTTKSAVGLDLTRLLIGSEGTLALITQATLKLLPLPEAKNTIRVLYRSLEDASTAVANIMAQAYIPSALEIMDKICLELLRHDLGQDFFPQANAMLLIEIDGHEKALHSGARSIELAARNEGLIAFEVAGSEAEAIQLYDARKRLSPALRRVADGKINEDIVVPVSKIALFLRKVQALAKHHQLTIASFGHAGNGNLHVNILYDLKDKAQCEAAQLCLEQIFDAVLTLGGTLSGEHGVGLLKVDYVHREISKDTLTVMHRVAEVFDPYKILNPGKGIPE
ncbi:MAG: FAD-binding oxidoreductase [Candidatus Oxydemutatoraceae bacterium WSBS_2016_MAG_OTU14]